LMYSPGNNWVCLQLHLCLVSFSPSKVGTVQFCAPPTIPWDYLSDLPCPCSRRLTCYPGPTLRLFSLTHPDSPNSVPCPTLTGLFSIPPHPHCQW
jgi:hypothetical protein